MFVYTINKLTHFGVLFHNTLSYVICAFCFIYYIHWHDDDTVLHITCAFHNCGRFLKSLIPERIILSRINVRRVLPLWLYQSSYVFSTCVYLRYALFSPYPTKYDVLTNAIWHPTPWWSDDKSPCLRVGKREIFHESFFITSFTPQSNESIWD